MDGFELRCGKRSGGIRSLALIAIDDIIEIRYGLGNGQVNEIILKEGKSFSEYEFIEDEAYYKEEISTNKGLVNVVHMICFSLEGMDQNSRCSIEGIIDKSRNGMAAVVTAHSGVSYLVGISEKFGKEQPLKVKSISSHTGGKLSDRSSVNVTLRSVDTSQAARVLWNGFANNI